MKTAKQLREERATKIEAMQAIHATAGSEKRSLNKEEKEKWDALNKEVEALAEEVRTVEAQEALDAEMAASKGKNVTGNTRKEDNSEKEKRELAKYSVLKVIQARMNEVPLDGLELEMHQEAQKEARGLGTTISGIGIPSMVLGRREKRDNSVTMPTQPEDGSAIVDTQFHGSMLDMLRNALVTRQLGATYLNDLTGNLSFTRVTERPIASWKPEVGELDKTNTKFAADEFTPKRLGTYVVESKQFLNQTSMSVEQKIRQEILYSIAEGVDAAAVTGSGASNEPSGILKLATDGDIDVVALGANGAALTRGNLITAETTLANNNILGRNFGWLLNSLTRGKLKDTPVATGSDKFIMESNGTLMEYPVQMSNVVPANLTKGTGTDLSAAIFGEWSQLYIGQWGGIDLIVDPYTLATAGQVKIVAQGFFNVYVRQPKAFVVFNDIITT